MGLFVLSFAFYFLHYGFSNDHFDRISRARQIARYGELPFRDFFDPGYFMALFSSAALQALLGDNLLGEALLNTTFMALGAVLIFFLSRRISGSSILSLVVTVVAVLSMPRFYDYDKFLFYPLGVSLCWRYIDRPTTANVFMLALGTVGAALFRYDSGVYVSCAAAVTLAAVHARARATLLRRLGAFALAVTVFALPFALFLHLNAGIPETFRQIAIYARREGGPYVLKAPPFSFPGPLLAFEPPPPGPRTIRVRWAPDVDHVARGQLESRYRLLDGERDGDRTWAYRIEDPSTTNVRALVENPRVEDTHFIDRGDFVVNPPVEPLWTRLRRAVPLLRLRILPGQWTIDNAATCLYVLVVGLAVGSGLTLLISHARGRPGDPGQQARLLSLTAMCLVVDVFIFRGTYQVRFGAIGPTAVLSAWAIRASWPWPAREVGRVGSEARWGLRGRRAVRVAGLAAVLVLAVLSLSTVANWRGLPAWTATVRAADFTAGVRDLATSPVGLNQLPSSRLEGLVSYARECTRPDDRILATWFVPELYFFARRAFAGGMVVFFNRHWSDLRDQRRIHEQLLAQSVPIVIIETASYDTFRTDYALLDQYLRLNYRVAGETSFGNPDVGLNGYRVLVHNDRIPTRTDARWSMPCF